MQSVYPATTISTGITYPSSDYPLPTYGTGTTTQQANGWANYTANVIAHRPAWSNGAGRKGIIACHGNNQTAWSSFHQGDDATWGDYIRELGDAGYVVVAADLGALSYGNNLALSTLDACYAYLTAITGGTTVGLMGSSGGGLAALNWLHKRPSQVKATYLINPFIDVDWARGTSTWTVPWSVQPGDPNASLYPGTGGTADPTNYNGAYLCSDDAGWATNAVGQQHTPARYPGDYAGKRIRIAKSQQDPTIPYQQDAWWVGAVNSPTVTLRMVTCSTAGHLPYTLLGGGTTDTATTAASGLPRAEIRDFFNEFL